MAFPPQQNDQNDQDEYLAADEMPRRHVAMDYQPPRFLRILRRTLLVLVVSAGLAVLYTSYWFVVASNLKDGVKNWVAHRSGSGISLTYKRIEIGGFPFVFRIIIRAPNLIAAKPMGDNGLSDFVWRSDGAMVDIKPWDLRRTIVNLSGRHDVEFTQKGVRHQFRGAIDQLLVDTKTHSDQIPETIQVTLKGVDMKGRRSGEEILISQARIFAQRLFPENVSEKTPTFAFNVDVDNAKLPAQLKLPLGHSLAKLVSDGKVMGLIQDPLSIDDLARWRDAGGTIEVERFEVKYGSLVVRANGTFAFDQEMQPVAAVTANIQGFFPAIRALRDANLIRSRDATMVSLVLRALARRPTNGSPASISLPLSLQAGKLTAGPVLLMDIPSIPWPRKPTPKEGVQRLR